MTFSNIFYCSTKRSFGISETRLTNSHAHIVHDGIQPHQGTLIQLRKPQWAQKYIGHVCPNFIRSLAEGSTEGPRV